MPNVNHANHNVNHSALRRGVMQYLRFRFPGRVYCVPYRGGLGMVPGTPDILGCIDGRFFAIEIKTGKAQLSVHQKAAVHSIDAAGGIAMVVRSLEEVIEAFQPFTTIRRNNV